MRLFLSSCEFHYLPVSESQPAPVLSLTFFPSPFCFLFILLLVKLCLLCQIRPEGFNILSVFLQSSVVAISCLFGEVRNRKKGVTGWSCWEESPTQEQREGEVLLADNTEYPFVSESRKMLGEIKETTCKLPLNSVYIFLHEKSQLMEWIHLEIWTSL